MYNYTENIKITLKIFKIKIKLSQNGFLIKEQIV